MTARCAPAAAFSLAVALASPAPAQEASFQAPGLSLEAELFEQLPDRAKTRLLRYEAMTPEFELDAEDIRLLQLSGRDRDLASQFGSTARVLRLTREDRMAWALAATIDDPYAEQLGLRPVPPLSPESTPDDYAIVQAWKHQEGFKSALARRWAGIATVRPGVASDAPPPTITQAGPARRAGEAPLTSDSLRIAQTYYTRGFVEVGILSVGDQAYCSGTLVAPTWVLTAAHCVLDPATGTASPTTYAAETLRFFPQGVSGQSGYRTTTGQRRDGRLGLRATAVHTYSTQGDWNARIDTDLALIRLEGARPDGAHLPVTAAPDLPDGRFDITIAGYGASGLNAEIGDGLDVGWQLAELRGIGTLQWTGAPNLTDSCTGDSGGPVFSGTQRGLQGETRTLVGVVRDRGCAAGGAVEAFTGAAFLNAEVRQWIVARTAAPIAAVPAVPPGP